MQQDIRPYNKRGKKEEVEVMFDQIAHRYDFLNHLFSLGIDRIWRKKALKLILRDHPASLLDVATGTADFAIAAATMDAGLKKIVGIDLSEGMLSKGRLKLATRELSNRIQLVKGDSEKLPFSDGSFASVTVAFGVRNFENLDKGLAEIHRVVSRNGPVVVLEFSRPTRFPVKQVFGFYFKRVMPLVGRMLSKDHRAYSYLPESVDKFPSGEQFLQRMAKAGFRELEQIPLSGGIASIYFGRK